MRPKNIYTILIKNHPKVLGFTNFTSKGPEAGVIFVLEHNESYAGLIGSKAKRHICPD